MNWNDVKDIKPDPDLHRGTVAGVTFVKGYPENLRKLQKLLGYDPDAVTVELKRNPDNKFDSNACEVWAAGEFIGHLPKDLAAELAPKLDKGAAVDAKLTSIGAPNNDPSKLGVGFSVRVL